MSQNPLVNTNNELEKILHFHFHKYGGASASPSEPPKYPSKAHQ